MSEREKLIFIVSGETSGDNLAARLMQALKQETGGRVRFAGVGGPQSEKQGLQSLFPMSELSLMGLAEVLPHLPLLAKRLNETVAAARALQPDAVVTVDSPDFCLRVCERLRGSGFPVIHYVAPQLWAWRPGRARKLARKIDHLMALLPFEVPFFAQYGVPCSYDGHPAIESAAGKGDGDAFTARHHLPADATLLCVIPGSRRGEVRHMLPIFAEAIGLLKARHPDLHVVIPVVHTTEEAVREATQDWPLPVLLLTDLSERYDAFAASDAAMAKSGTVSLELALAGVPMAVGYRVSPVTAFIGRRLINVEHASLANLLTGRAIIPEFIQENCTPQKLAETVDALLEPGAAREVQRAGFREVVEVLGNPEPPPSVRAARVVLDLIRARPASES
jgi:lipid-A-disaccharide synthase